MAASFLTRLGAATAVAILALGGPGARAQTLADVLVRTYESNPTLQIARAGLRQADERVVQAQSDLYPDISATASTEINTLRQGLSSRPYELQTLFEAQAAITGQIELYTGGRIPAQIASAIASVMAARARLLASEQDVLLSAIEAYMDVRRDIQFVELARNNVRVLTEQLRATQDRFEVGEVTRTDVSQAEAALAASRANLAVNTGALAQSRARFLSVVGEEAKDLAPPPPLPQLPKTREEAEAIAVREHPVLAAARFNEEAAGHDIDVARAGLMPILALQGSVFYQYADQISEPTGVRDADNFGASIGLNLTIPLYRGGELDSFVRQAVEVLAQRKAETQDAGRQIRQAVQTSWSGLSVARASIAANQEQVQAQELAFQGVVEEAKFGERTTLDVLDAEQALLQARSDLVSARRDEYVAAYNVLSSMGLLTVSHLGLAVAAYDPAANYDAVQRRPAVPEGPRIERILDRWGDK
jgi:outer membrane protein